jgi:hypothetical protein
LARDTIFISHATPEDNDFVRWLGARLTGHGYKVWADLFDLRGGTPFWNSIEEALRHHACKVVFIVSKTSVDPNRTGMRNELSVADSMRKRLNDSEFIIPVRIDDTPFSEFPIQIHQLNGIDFAKSWGPKLIELLDTLEHGNVPTFEGERTADFERWRQTIVRTSASIEIAPEQVVTNLLPITRLPARINFFEYDQDSKKVAATLNELHVPGASFLRLMISFADLTSIQELLPPEITLRMRANVPFGDFLAAEVTAVTSPQRDEARKIATSLLKQHVESFLERKGLKRFELSRGATFYFPSGLIPNNKIPYVAASGRKTNKNVVGRSERYKVNWHLAMTVNLVLGPPAIVRFKPYVCFSEDGLNALGDAKRTAAIRRRFCKNWWNRHWRQLQEAFCVFLAGDKWEIEIELGGSEHLMLAGRLLELTATRTMPDDLQVSDEPDDPIELDDEPEEQDSTDEIESEDEE